MPALIHTSGVTPRHHMLLGLRPYGNLQVLLLLP